MSATSPKAMPRFMSYDDARTCFTSLGFTPHQMYDGCDHPFDFRHIVARDYCGNLPRPTFTSNWTVSARQLLTEFATTMPKPARRCAHIADALLRLRPSIWFPRPSEYCCTRPLGCRPSRSPPARGPNDGTGPTDHLPELGMPPLFSVTATPHFAM